MSKFAGCRHRPDGDVEKRSAEGEQQVFFLACDCTSQAKAAHRLVVFKGQEESEMALK